MRKNSTKRIISTALLLLGLSVMTACKSNEPTTEDVKSPSTVEEPTTEEPIDSENEQQPATDGEKEPDTSNETDNGQSDTEEYTGPTKELPIYTINEETLESDTYTALIPEESELTPELIVKYVVDAFAAENIDIKTDSITMEKTKEENDTIVVSFFSTSAPVAEVGSGIEETILDCISMSLLDNLEDCNYVTFRVEGEAYMSGHLAFEKTEAYKWK